MTTLLRTISRYKKCVSLRILGDLVFENQAMKVLKCVIHRHHLLIWIMVCFAKLLHVNFFN
jgi:hypothetical protein